MLHPSFNRFVLHFYVPAQPYGYVKVTSCVEFRHNKSGAAFSRRYFYNDDDGTQTTFSVQHEASIEVDGELEYHLYLMQEHPDEERVTH